MVQKCPHGKLKSPVRNKAGVLRRCKLKPKTKKGRSMDRKSKSGEFHEVRHRKDKRKGIKRCKKGVVKSGPRKGLCKKR